MSSHEGFDDSRSAHSDDESHDETVDVENRDEVKEVRKMSSKDTSRILFWRVVVTVVLLLTAFAVTFATKTFLDRQEVENFETAFEQFSRTVGNAAYDQQRKIHDSYVAFCNFYSQTASDVNASWPFYSLPNYEMHAGMMRKQSGNEILNIIQFVKDNDVAAALEYVGKNYEEWSREGHLLRYGSLDRLTPANYQPNFTIATPQGKIPDTVQRDQHYGMWQFSPPSLDYGLVNWDLINSFPDFGAKYHAMLELRNETVMTGVRPYHPGSAFKELEHDALHSQIAGSKSTFPHTFISRPVHKVPGDTNSEIVAAVGGAFAWDFALRNLLPEGVVGISVEIENSCNQTFSYEITGPDAFFVGEGAKHEYKYDHMKVVRMLSLHTHPSFTTIPGHCYYSMSIFPSTKFEQRYHSETPKIFAGVVASTFVLVAIVFLIYDIFVQRRNENLIFSAAKSNAIVSSIFPEEIRKRLVGEDEQSSKHSSPNHLKSFLSRNAGSEGNGNQDANKSKLASKPLADLFLETTVMFADICGFTAWSSVREPSQVFLLLESVYSAFDKIAKRRRVFKVETVGDCYVAVTGLPEPRRDHAVLMVRFARNIMAHMKVLTKNLEVTLGPDTGELSLRIGIHSGPVTGGVLRGERSRFQLFGDTINTTARIENSGEPGRIHLSEETAELLIKAGKRNWVRRRNQEVLAKGKGLLQTYWLSLNEERGGTNNSSDGEKSIIDFSDMDTDQITNSLENRESRLINWNVEQLSFLLKQVVAHRCAVNSTPSNVMTSAAAVLYNSKDHEYVLPLDEVQEIIRLPKFDRMVSRKQKSPEQVEIPDKVVEQLKMYVAWIASMYRSNPFHNFDHASHVLMSVVKLMSRIVAPSDLLEINEREGKSKVAATLHDHTYGITSDPLTQFACALSALIHDVDHTGVPNAQLVAEKTDIAARYMDRSVAEQNSLDLAWNTLMEPKYSDLRSSIFSNECERVRFRQLVVNSVLATDIVDKDLKNLRNARWEKAFNQETLAEDNNLRDGVNRKATIVIEHLIQASDVSHTMQHWHVFRKWNQRLFEEMHAAYRAGRAGKDPAEFWYQGEIGFFDFYIIPLAKKLKDCGVFGVSSDEFLNYAQKNRAEWEARGQELVAEMVEAVTKKQEQEANQKLIESDVLRSGLLEV